MGRQLDNYNLGNRPLKSLKFYTNYKLNTQYITNMPPMKMDGKMIGDALMHSYTCALNTQTHTWYLTINIIGHIQNIKKFI